MSAVSEPVFLSVVIPAFNEEAVIEELHSRLSAVLATIHEAVAEILYVNDGSRDSTLAVIEALRKEDHRVGILDLSRNFGKEAALTAGLDAARGDVVVVMDADLQDPPELIPEMLSKWKEGFDVVYAMRVSRKGEPFLKRFTAHLFYRVIQQVSRVYIPKDTGDFRLLSRRAVEAVKMLREQHRFMKGLFAWIGYSQTEIRYERPARKKGLTKWGYWRLWNFALDGFTSFSTAPLKLAAYLGSMVSFGAFSYAAIIISKTILFGDPVPGYPSLMVTILLFSGIQLIFIGVIGEYLGRMFDETKCRPLYFVNRFDLPVLHGYEEDREIPGVFLPSMYTDSDAIRCPLFGAGLARGAFDPRGIPASQLMATPNEEEER
ncbi:MAG: glycosyltransferase family 2 protein [Syntrophobacteraceae bacterium]